MPYYLNENPFPVVVSMPSGAAITVKPHKHIFDESGHYSLFPDLLSAHSEEPPAYPKKPRAAVEPHDKVREADLAVLKMPALRKRAASLGVQVPPGMPKSAILQLICGSHHEPDLEALHVLRRQAKPAQDSKGTTSG